MTGDAVHAERSIIVGDRLTETRLTAEGIASSTFGDVLSSPDRVTMRLFATEPAVLVVRPGEQGQAAAAANRLDRLGLHPHVVNELCDPGRLP